MSCLAQPARAAVLTWDPAANGSCSGGAGTWNTASWYSSGLDGPWVNGNDAVFQGAGGAVTLNAMVAPTSVTFNSAGYSISGGTVNFINSGTITTNAASATINSPVTAGATLSTSGSGTLTISGGLNANELYQNGGSGLLTVYQPAGFSGTIGSVNGAVRNDRRTGG